MGQQQSAEKASKSGEKEKKVKRRTSIQTLTNPKSTVADPSASTASATAETIQQQIQKPALQQHLHDSSDASKASEIGRSSSRASSRSKPSDSQAKSSASAAAPVSASPMNVPAVEKPKPQDDFDTNNNAHYETLLYTPVSYLRPPRLPLPIADAIPESPSLHPLEQAHIADDDIPSLDPGVLGPDDQQAAAAGIAMTPGAIRRQSSVLSTATQDDEEIGDELQAFNGDGVTQEAVPVRIDWPWEGNRVYVTGTFANWERKFRLQPKDTKEGKIKSVTIGIPPGTHHLKFIVDGEMMISKDLPTAVDYTNVLVNYIEVSADEIPRREVKTAAHPAHPPMIAEEAGDDDSDADAPGEDDARRLEMPEDEEIPMGDFRQIIPQALIDMELPDDDARYRQAEMIVKESPAPPSLPTTLSKSILNGNLPMKDDASVLTLPNHTVLNHMMTSAIKNGVLATSVTTRYEKKYVTTIMYKPVKGASSKD